MVSILRQRQESNQNTSLASFNAAKEILKYVQVQDFVCWSKLSTMVCPLCFD